MDKVQKTSDSECCTPSSEPCRSTSSVTRHPTIRVGGMSFHMSFHKLHSRTWRHSELPMWLPQIQRPAIQRYVRVVWYCVYHRMSHRSKWTDLTKIVLPKFPRKCLSLVQNTTSHVACNHQDVSLVDLYRFVAFCSVISGWSWPQSSWVEFILRPTLSRPVHLGIGLPFGAHDQILSFPFFSDNCFVVLSVGRPLWRKDGSVTYSAIANCSGYWGPIMLHYRLI
jgi:hypothetical protein